MPFELTEQQEKAILMVQDNNLSALIGGPGTGKTTATKAIIKWAKKEDIRVLQAAPTGKAAKRMMEATGKFASTIHSMLGCEMDEDGNFRFIHNEEKPLSADLIILDEISMITVDLMFHVLRAIKPYGTKVLLIGDQYQLPSIGPGAVLRDIIDSKLIPVTELDKIHRNTGYIVEACHMIKHGIVYNPYRMLDFQKENPINLIHIECFSSSDIMRTIEKLVLDVLPAKKLPGKEDGFNSLEDIQVISPVNKKGDLSCQGINRVLRDALNKPDVDDSIEQHEHEQAFLSRRKAGEESETKAPLLFRVGDKVIQTKNEQTNGMIFAIDEDGSMIPDKNDPTGHKRVNAPVYIVNGDIGFVVELDEDRKNMIVRFSDPTRFVKIGRKNNDLLHAYCITCHKFQGSEAPAIIIPVDKAYSYIMYNAWIYTAISRAKIVCITVGSFQVIDRAIKNIRPNNRITRLKERLWEKHRAVLVDQFGYL